MNSGLEGAPKPRRPQPLEPDRIQPAMSRLRTTGLVAQSLLYIAGGINHLWHPATYTAIMPDHYTHPAGWVAFTGVAEITGGLGLLLPATRRAAAIAIALMLLGYFDVHVSMLLHSARYPAIPRWLLAARIPLQFALIAWALIYARRQPATSSS